MSQIALRLEFGALGCFSCTGKNGLVSFKIDERFGDVWGGRSNVRREHRFVIS